MSRRRSTRPKQPNPYTGELAKPLEMSPYLHMVGWRLAPGDLLPRDTPEYLVQARRVELLFEHYQVKSGDWHSLAMKLAAVHVPGLQVVAPTMPKRRRGRPRKLAKSPRLGLGQIAVPQSASERKKGGHPVFWSPKHLKAIKIMADRWQAQEREKGKKRPTDIAFVRWYCAHEGLDRTDAERALASALSRARKPVSQP